MVECNNIAELTVLSALSHRIPKIYLPLSGFGDNWFPRQHESHSPSVYNAMDNMQMTWMSWKHSFQARAPVAFRAAPISAKLQASCSVRTERVAIDCRNCSSVLCTYKSWEMAEGSNYYVFFCLFCLLVFLWEISRSDYWQERKFGLCFWKWCWLTLEVTKKIQGRLKVLAYPLFLERTCLWMCAG